MATQQTIMVDGKPYVLLPRDEYEKLTVMAKAAEREQGTMPELIF